MVEVIGHQVELLVDRTREFLSTLPAAKPFLETWPPPRPGRSNPPGSPSALPVTSRLPELCRLTAATTAPLVTLLAETVDLLQWRQTYTAADFGPEFLQHYGWTELVGLRGPIASTDIACGFLLLGPGIEYPLHSHEAEELYVPLAGGGLWQRGTEDFVERPNGAPIHHPSWMPHAMRTQTSSLLALYMWSGGDLSAKSKII
jgi:Dimethlysulfonioproprionate lyase